MTWKDDYLAVMNAVIHRYGHAVQYVLDDRERGGQDGPPFAYTIGLHTQPGRDYELALSALDPERAAGLLNDLAAHLAEHHLTPTEGMAVPGLLHGGLNLLLRRVSRPDELVLIDGMYSITPPVWQALWPDPHGRYPGDPGYLATRAAQILL
jgi:hypothetical protein